jgi:hypothetical protein
MLSSLNIASSSSCAGAAGSSGSNIGSASAIQQQQQQQQRREKQQRRESLQAEVQHLQYQLTRVTTDLATVGPRLPDGGSKVRSMQR